MAMFLALKDSTTFANFKSRYLQIIETLIPPQDGDPDVYAQADALLNSVRDGNVILTAALKGLPSVIEDMSVRSTGVAAVLIESAVEPD